MSFAMRRASNGAVLRRLAFVAALVAGLATPIRARGQGADACTFFYGQAAGPAAGVAAQAVALGYLWGLAEGPAMAAMETWAADRTRPLPDTHQEVDRGTAQYTDIEAGDIEARARAYCHANPEAYMSVALLTAVLELRGARWGAGDANREDTSGKKSPGHGPRRY